jgi:hypothetical protein
MANAAMTRGEVLDCVFHRAGIGGLCALLASACGTSARAIPAPSVPVRTVVALHADVGFTPAERALLTWASNELARQARVDVRLTYDLDFARPSSLRRFDILIRTTSDLERVPYLDSRFHGRVLGYTVWSDRRAELVVDRLKDPRRFVHAAEHEFLHLAGVNHAVGGTIMNASMAREPSAILNEEDWSALEAAPAR